MKAVVTGASGLVGAHIVRALLSDQHSVRALVRASSNVSAIEELPVDRVYADVLRPKGLSGAIRGCDVVFHAAANFTYWGKSDSELDAVAVRGTSNVLKAAARCGVSRVIVTSSSVVLGYSDDGTLVDESTCSRPNETNAPYVNSKIRQDDVALELAAKLDLNLILVCPTVVVGPFAPHLGPSNSVITSYLEDPLRLTYPGGCNIISAADVGIAHVLAAKLGVGGERYIAGGENLEWRTLHAMISRLCGTYGPLFTLNHVGCYLAAFLEETRARFLQKTPATTRTQSKMIGRFYWYDHRKLSSLGFRAVPAATALATAISWLVSSSHLSREARCNIQLGKKVWEARTELRRSEQRFRAAKQP